jgi:NAD-dependent SIR2 family protein deacetylase
MAYASGKYSLAICDRCGFRYKYTQLRKEWNNLFVCPECYEPKAPQIDPVPHVADPEAIRDPRPQAPPSIVAGEGVVRTIDANSMMTITGDSIGSAFSSSSATGEVGTVTVVIS